MEILKLEVALSLHAHLDKCKYNCMHVSKYLTHGNLFGAFCKKGNVTSVMFTYQEEFFELEYEVRAGKVFMTMLAATSDISNLKKMAETRLSNYVDKRISDESLWAALGIIPKVKRKVGRLYQKRCGHYTDNVRKKNMSLTVEHNLAVNFTERLTGYNIKLGCKALA